MNLCSTILTTVRAIPIGIPLMNAGIDVALLPENYVKKAPNYSYYDDKPQSFSSDVADAA